MIPRRVNVLKDEKSLILLSLFPLPPLQRLLADFRYLRIESLHSHLDQLLLFMEDLHRFPRAELLFVLGFSRIQIHDETLEFQSVHGGNRLGAISKLLVLLFLRKRVQSGPPNESFLPQLNVFLHLHRHERSILVLTQVAFDEKLYFWWTQLGDLVAVTLQIISHLWRAESFVGVDLEQISD